MSKCKYNIFKNDVYKMYMNNLSIKKISENIGLSTSTVRSYIIRLKYEKYNNVIRLKSGINLVWSDDESLQTAESLGIHGYSNKYKNYTYRIITYK